MSNTMKVYDAAGRHVESFRVPSKQQLWDGHPSMNRMIRILNKGGYFVRKQLPPAVSRKLTKKRREKKA